MSIKGIVELLKANNLDPDETIEIDGRTTSIFIFTEAHIMGVFDQIEEAKEGDGG